MTEGKELEPKGPQPPQEGSQDDLYDGLLWDVVSREVARRGGHEALDRFYEFLEQEKAQCRQVEVDRFPTEPEQQDKVHEMVLPRLSRVRESQGLPQLPILGPAIEGLMGAVEDMAESLGLRVESKSEGGETQEQPEGLDKTTKRFTPVRR